MTLTPEGELLMIEKQSAEKETLEVQVAADGKILNVEKRGSGKDDK